MKKIIVLLIGLIYSYSAFADVSSKLLALKTTLNPFIVKSKKDSKRSRRSFASFDPNDVLSRKATISKSKAQAFIRDRGKNLDLDGNGVDSMWRHYTRGKISKVTVDSNEDGKIDRVYHYYSNKKLRFKKIDTDFNGKFDVKESCSVSGDKCVKFQSYHSGRFNKKTVTIVKKGKGSETVYKTKNGKWNLSYERSIGFSQATEGGHSHCEDCGTSDKVESTSNIKDVIKGLREVAISKPNYVQFDNMIYEALGSGLFLNKNCYESDNSRDTLLEKINQTLEGMVSCLNESSDWLRDQGLLKHANSMDNNILGQLSNHLSGVGGPLKITCTALVNQSSRDRSKIENRVAMAAYLPKQFPLENQKNLVLRSGDIDEKITGNTISIVSNDILRANKKFSRALYHELIHIITGIRHGEAELAYSCSNMCEQTAGDNFVRKGKLKKKGRAVRKLCGFDNEQGDAPGMEYENKKGIDAILSYVLDTQRVFVGAEETDREMYQSWLMTYWKRNKEELILTVLGNEKAEDALLGEFISASKMFEKEEYKIEKEYLITALKKGSTVVYSKPEAKLSELFLNLMAESNVREYFRSDIKTSVKEGQSAYAVVYNLKRFLDPLGDLASH